MTWEEVKKTNIVELVDDPTWQSLRKTFIGTWKDHCVDNTKTLEDFLKNFNNTNEFPKYCRIVYNYLTGSYFRINDYKLCTEVKSLRKKVRECTKNECMSI